MYKAKTIILIAALSLSIFSIVYSIQNEPIVNVNIIFEDSIDNEFLSEISAKITQRFESFQGVSVAIPQSIVPFLDKVSFIKSWEYVSEVHLLQDSIDWGVDRVNAEVVWGGAENAVDVTTGVCGSTVKLAIIDTGIDMNHPDLSVAGGYDFVNNDNNPDDDQGHGTHVAGTIAALDNGNGLVGVAPCVQLYGVKVLSSSGSGTDTDVAAGIEWAGDNGMDIASLSLGSSSPSSTIQAAGQYAASKGVLLVAASGNDGASSVGYPAAYSEFMAVGATDSSDNIAYFSNRGSAMEISAPGVSIYSTYMGGGYNTLSGTSMATPHVSAVAALVMSSDSSLTASDVRSRLQSTADDVGSSGWDSTYGYGIVNAEAAVSGGGGGGDDTNGGTLQNGVTVTDLLTSSTDTDVWTIDVASNAASIRVQLDSGSNDFDFFASHTTSNPTHSNNEFEGYTSGGEDVTFNNPGAGTWYIVVDQYSGTGTYSLTVTVTYGGGGGGGDTNGGTLENGVTVTDLLTSSTDSDIWTLDVASSAVSIRVQLDSGSNDFDFFASHTTSNPTHSNNEFEGYTSGGEDVTFSNPGAGTWYFVVDQYSGTGEYSLTVTVTYGGGGGGGDTFELSIYTYDWDIAGEVDLLVNGVQLDWEAQGVAGDASYKTYTFDITSIAGSSLQIIVVDTYGSYTNYFKNLQIYRNGVYEVDLQSSWLDAPGNSGVSYTYNL